MSQKKKLIEAVTCDMASSDWLKLAPFVCFVRKVYIEINYKFICDCAGERPQSDISALLSNLLSIAMYKPFVFAFSDYLR